MKKFLTVLLTAAMILTAAACGEAPAETSATTAATDAPAVTEDEAATPDEDITEAETEETEPEETEAETEATTEAVTEAVTEATTEATTEAVTETTTEATKAETKPEIEGEYIENAMMDGLKDKSPLYYDFGMVTSTMPCTIVMTLIDGNGGEIGAVAMTMTSLDRLAMKTTAEGETVRVIIADGKYYIVSDTEKSALYYTLTAEEIEAMAEEMKSTTASTAAFNFDNAEFTSGTEEFLGETYKYEMVDDGVSLAKLYFDTETGRAKYLINESQAARIDDYYTGSDESLFEIPASYETIDMAALFGGQQ